MGDYRCPKCQSENVQKVSLIVEMGSANSKSATLTAGTNKNIYLSGTATSHISELAKKYALQKPPKRGYVSNIVIIAIFIALFGLVVLGLGYTGLTKEPDPELPPGTIFPIILLCAGVAIIGYSYKFYANEMQKLSKYDDEVMEYETSLAEYNKKYLCLRCGAEFQKE